MTVSSHTVFPIALAQSGAVRKDREELPVHSERQHQTEGLCEAVTSNELDIHHIAQTYIVSVHIAYIYRSTYTYRHMYKKLYIMQYINI